MVDSCLGSDSVCDFWIFPDAWTGFSLLAFRSLELWHYTAVILMVGALQNPAIAVVVSHSTLLIWEIVFAFESKVHIIQTTVNWIAVGAGWQFLDLQAEQRVRTWGGPTELQRTSTCSTQRICEI
ncbi:unnamed protein product [Camellia sinensis]